MPWGTVKLTPGVVTQLTPSQNVAGVSVSNLIRYHDGLIQKLGGWQKYYSQTISSTIREIHGWEGLSNNQFLSVGTPSQLGVIHSDSLSDITPQTRTSSFAPNFTSSAGSNIITVIDANANLTTYDSVFFNTPISIGGTILMGGYQVNTVGGSTTYTILSSAAATSNVTSSGTLPVFTTTGANAAVTVDFSNNGFLSAPGLFYGFFAPTSIGGNLTIEGPYAVASIIDSTEFVIVSPTQATSADTQTMNAGLAQVVYYIGQGPPAGGSGYGVGGYGLGGYGMGSPTASSTGAAITATDWTMDNWGEILLSCPTDGPIYQWASDSGFSTAIVIPGAPFFNGGIYVSQPQQILVAWRSCLTTGVQDNLTVRWSDAGDFTNWTVSSQTAAGSFHIPTGSKIIGGIQAGTKGVIWTDIDVWLQTYVGGDLTFNHTRMGTGCGLIGPHAAGFMNEAVFWMGLNNIYVLDNNGVSSLPCSVWDYVFQNINTSYTNRVRCAVNSMFNEVTWYFPSATSTGENDSYIRYNQTEGTWDYGTLQRNAWIDSTALGNPIGTDNQLIYQHELTNDADTTPIQSSFQTGYWTIAEGEELVFVDFFVPDMKFGKYSLPKTAQVEMTLSAVDYVGDTPRTYGPFTFTSTTRYLNPRLRGRYMSMTIDSNDLGSFWRIGAIKYRYNSVGRR